MGLDLLEGGDGGEIGGSKEMGNVHKHTHTKDKDKCKELP